MAEPFPTDADLQQRADQRYRWLTLGVDAILAVTPIFFLVVAVVGIARGGSWWLLVLPPIGLLALVPALWFMRLRRQGHPRFPGPIRLFGADRSTRRRVTRSVRRGVLPPAEPDRSLGLEMAQGVVSTSWRLWIQAVIVPIFTLNVIIQENLWSRVLFGIAAALNAVSLVWEWVILTRVKELLRDHPA